MGVEDQKFVCEMNINCTCRQMGIHPCMFCVASFEIRRAIITTGLFGAKYWPLQICTKLVHNTAVFYYNCAKLIEISVQEWEEWNLMPVPVNVSMLLN